MTRLFWVWAALMTCICGRATPAFATDTLVKATPPAVCAWDDSEPYQGLRRADVFAPGEVALTFDDGPQPVPTKKLLDVLDEHGYSATFFVVGLWVRADTYQLIQRMAASGHEIGTHTYSHDEHLTRRGWGVDYIEGQYELTHVLVELALLATSPKEFNQLYRRVFEHKPGVPRRRCGLNGGASSGIICSCSASAASTPSIASTRCFSRGHRAAFRTKGTGQSRCATSTRPRSATSDY